jgi:hypothetical protein
MKKITYMSMVIILAVISQAKGETLRVDFNGSTGNGGATVVQTQSEYEAYNASNELISSFGARIYSAFGTTITVTPTWVAGATTAAPQAWNRGNSYGYSTDPAHMLDLVSDWIGTDQRQVGDPMTLTIAGLPAGTYTWKSYHHDTQNQTGHFSVTVNDAAGSNTTANLQVSSSQSLSDLTLADVSKFETTITSNGINPVSFVWDATDTPDYFTMFVINGFEISDGQTVDPEQPVSSLRRPISPQQPMWLVHIDTWNYADPQKIIALIPQDIRPYVVMNISLSISHDEATSRFQVAEYGYEVARSWLRACAENRMWAMVQPSSGGFSQFSDFDLSVYEEFYRDYPNMIGFNYCEQFWGYDSSTDPLSAAWTDRIAHFANLLQLSQHYGGYVVVSWCANQWSPPINPIGMLKRIPAFAAACRQYTENYILLEKYTQQSYQSDMESVCLGAWLSGYSGQYGIRYDDTGWTDAAGDRANFTMATGGAPHLEHMMLTGQTVIDAPELIWTQCFRELGAGGTTDGYTMRRWGTYPQFDNVSVDIFRKVLDGTVRIPSRREVIDRTKFVIINNVNSGSNNDIYSSPQTLFEGLYRMDGDGNYEYNKTFFKKTGRYPTIPTVYQLDDADAQSFQVKVNRSAYSTRWPSISSKVTEFNGLFPEEYTGDIYAGRHENGWVTYNPYKTGQTAAGSIPFKYNTCNHMELTYSQYTAGVIKEYTDHVTFYLSNYDNVINTGLKTDTIKIYGSTLEPTWSSVDRASHQASTVTKSWADGVFTLTVQHNGPIDITVNCAGSATGRLTDYTPSVLISPTRPLNYTGPLQYEGECFDYKSVAGIVKGGYSDSVRNYTGQGYLRFGTNSAAGVRDTVTVLKSGTYRLETRYSVTGATINTIDLYVNGTKTATPAFTQTATLSDWAINKQIITLNAGANTIELRANAAGASSIHFDNIVVVPMVYGYGTVIQENGPGFYGVDGVINNSYVGYTGNGYADTNNSSGAGIDWEIFFDSSVTKSFTFRYSCTDDRTANLIVNGQTVVSDISFPSTGAGSAWEFVTVYARTGGGISGVRLESTSAAGLPDIDYLEFIGGQVETTPPAAPTGLSATAVSSSQIDLTWDVSSDARSYNIKRASTSGGSYTQLVTGTTETSYSDTERPERTTYYYVITAVNLAGQSDDSTEANATTLNSPPAMPSGLTAAAGDSVVTLNWDANTESDLAGYNVYRSTTRSSGYTRQNGSLLNSPKFTDNNVINYRIYYYVVTAVDTSGSECIYSVEVEVMPLDSSTVPLCRADFENGLGDWANITGEDSHDWTLNSGGTITPNTGPDSGAGGSTRYIYLETSPGGAASAGNTAILQSPVISGYKRVLTFYYHMYGVETGTLNIDVYDGTWHNAVWSLSGQQHSAESDEYTPAIVNLAGYTGPIQIRFRAVAAGGPRGDMALDDIQVTGRIYGDMNGDRVVDSQDLPEFMSYWLQQNCALDWDGDCVVTLHEFAEFAGNWLEESSAN